MRGVGYDGFILCGCSRSCCTRFLDLLDDCYAVFASRLVCQEELNVGSDGVRDRAERDEFASNCLRREYVAEGDSRQALELNVLCWDAFSPPCEPGNLG